MEGKDTKRRKTKEDGKNNKWLGKYIQKKKEEILRG